MTSNTLAGDRRWGSARKGGMTVLGKVAVPKPLNLPSQRLENHGLDPNVEIVPKGTLSWGSRSSSTTNAWGSSTLSPNADSSANSPSHLSGRPSSGGSGTRPSTAGSGRPNEPTSSTWGPNSRPSSASGVLTSNQSSSTSMRPRSAETRPGSSQLSRFAEPVSDSPGAWGASGTEEKLGMALSKNDEFSLSSGDFPTLGSEKDHSTKSTESKDPGSHARPSSASGGVTLANDKTVTSQVDDLNGAGNRWKNDGSRNVGEGVQPSLEKWQVDQQQYFNPNVPPQHFDAWRGPPMNTPAGIWYRGPPGGPPTGPPYGAPVGPGGYPVEPFPYCRPQIPPPAFANSQPVPPPRGGPRGHYPKSGSPYRSQIPDAYLHPNMPFRPGFYPAPMAFEGYYGPPMGYCNSKECDIPFMGIGGPPVYDRYSVPKAPDPSDSHAKAGGSGPVGKTTSGDVEFAHSGDTQGPYKVLSKQPNNRDGKDQVENHRKMPAAIASHPVKAEKAGIKPRKHEWGAEDDEEEDIYSSHSFGFQGGWGPDTVQEKSYQSADSLKQAGKGCIKKLDDVTSSSLQMPQVSAPTGRDSSFRSTITDATLMQKLEGLNEKVRASDGRIDYASSGEVKKSLSDAFAAKVDKSAHEARKFAESVDITSASGYLAPTSHKVVVPAGDRMAHPATAAMSRRPYHGTSNRSDHRGKGMSSTLDADGWRRKPVAAEFSSAVAASKLEPASKLQEHNSHQPVEAEGVIPVAKDGGGWNTELHDATDSQAQRAKMRELAKQRAIQLQKEEEERTREQKAKALAKLEELNRRSQPGDASNETAKKPLASGSSQEQEGKDVEKIEFATTPEATKPDLLLTTEGVIRNSENSRNQVVGSAISFKALPAETSKSTVMESGPHDESVPLKQVVNGSANDGLSAPQLNDGGVSIKKYTNYKQKQNNTMQKNVNERSIPGDIMEVKKSHIEISVDDAASNVNVSEVSSSSQTYLPNNSGNASETSAQQRRRSSKNSKNKNKQDIALPVPAAMATAPSDSIPPKTASDNVNFQASNFDFDTGHVHSTVNVYSGGVEISEPQFSLPREEAHGKVNNQLKLQHARRMPRSQQINKVVDRFHGNDVVVWAPVRSENKAEIKDVASVEGKLNEISESVIPAKCDNLMQNSSKSKRAEMERYVPKPVAKELAQQVGVQQSVTSSVDIAVPDKNAIVQPVGMESGNAVSSKEVREGVVKHSKQGKVHGAWRQRGSREFSHAKNVQQGSSSTSYPRSSQNDMDESQLQNAEANFTHADTKISSELIACDRQIESSTSSVPAPDTAVSKDPLVTGKGKRQPYRGHRNMDNSHSVDGKNIIYAETDRTLDQSPVSVTTQSNRDVASKETRGTGERMPSHWQPKSHAPSAGSQRGSRITGSQNLGAEASRGIRKDFSRQQQVKTPPQHYESNELDGSRSDQYLSETKAVIEVPKVGTHEPRRGMKSASSKGPPYSSNQKPVGGGESTAAASTDTRDERQFPVGSGRNGNLISRYGRGHESRGDWSIRDNKQQDSQRHNMHYEYQPVGSHNNNKNQNFDGQADGSHNEGSRYRERGHSHPKRGASFHGRQSGRLHVHHES